MLAGITRWEERPAILSPVPYARDNHVPKRQVPGKLSGEALSSKWALCDPFSRTLAGYDSIEF